MHAKPTIEAHTVYLSSTDLRRLQIIGDDLVRRARAVGNDAEWPLHMVLQFVLHRGIEVQAAEALRETTNGSLL